MQDCVPRQVVPKLSILQLLLLRVKHLDLLGLGYRALDINVALVFLEPNLGRRLVVGDL